MSFSPQYSLYSPLLSIFLLMLAHGPFNTFVALEMEGNSVPIEVQGLIHSIYFFGLLLGPFCIERFMHKVGAIRSFIACCSAYAAAVALQALVPGLWVLVPMRFLAGLSISAIYLIIESWLMLAGGPDMRGRALSYYMISLYTGIAVGQFLLLTYDVGSLAPYLSVLFFLSLANIPVALTFRQAPATEILEPINAKGLIQDAFFGLTGLLISGMILSNVYSLFPIYFAEKNLSVPYYMALFIGAGALLQVLFGKLSDKYDRRTILLILSFTSGILFFQLEQTPPTSLMFPILIALLGGLSFSLYPISMAQVCDRYHADKIVKLTSYLMIVYGLGSIIGPGLSGLLMKYLGTNFLPASTGIYCTLFFLVGVVHLSTRRKISNELQVDTPVVGQTVVVSTENKGEERE